MKIAFKELLKEAGMSQMDLARELTAGGYFKTVQSAKTVIQYHLNGKYQSIDMGLLEYLMKRFDKTLCEIVKFD